MRTIRSLFVALALISACGLVAVGTRANAVAAPVSFPVVRSTHALNVDGLERSWIEATPKGVAANALPIVVFLHGSGATPTLEINRDRFLPLVSGGRVELIYPAGIDKTWDAGDGCCGKADLLGVNDVAFLKALVAVVDPGRARPIYLGGYSNGARMTYTVACDDPALFDGYIAVNGLPQPDCVVDHPVSLLQIDGTADTEVPFVAGDPGDEEPPVTTELDRLRTLDACPGSTGSLVQGSLELSVWHCRDERLLELAAYKGGTHAFEVGSPGTPGAANLLLSFISGHSS